MAPPPNRARSALAGAALALATAPAPAAVSVADFPAIAQLVESYAMLSRQIQQLAGIYHQNELLNETIGLPEDVHHFKRGAREALGALALPAFLPSATHPSAPDIHALLAGDAPTQPSGIRIDPGASEPDLHRAVLEGEYRRLNHPDFDSARAWAMEAYFVKADAEAHEPEAAGESAVARARHTLRRRSGALRSAGVDAYARAGAARSRYQAHGERDAQIARQLEQATTLREELSVLALATIEGLSRDAERNALLAQLLELEGHAAIAGAPTVVNEETWTALGGP